MEPTSMPNLLPAFVTVVGSIGVGLIGIAAAMFMRIFKSPRETNDDLASEIGKLRSDHHQLANNTAVLSNEVRHLSDNVKTLGEEVKSLWRGNASTRNGRGTQ